MALFTQDSLPLLESIVMAKEVLQIVNRPITQPFDSRLIRGLDSNPEQVVEGVWQNGYVKRGLHNRFHGYQREGLTVVSPAPSGFVWIKEVNRNRP